MKDSSLTLDLKCMLNRYWHLVITQGTVLLLLSWWFWETVSDCSHKEKIWFVLWIMSISYTPLHFHLMLWNGPVVFLYFDYCIYFSNFCIFSRW